MDRRHVMQEHAAMQQTNYKNAQLLPQKIYIKYNMLSYITITYLC